MVTVELLDNRRIKLVEKFDAPLNTVFEIWMHPHITKYLRLNAQNIKSINTGKLLKKISLQNDNTYNEISTSALLSKRVRMYSHFIELNGETEATITLDFKLNGLANRFLTPATDKALVLVDSIKDCIKEIQQ